MKSSLAALKHATVKYTPPPAVAYSAAVLADNPLAYWRLGETSGTTATDQKSSNNGTYVNAPTLGAPGAVAGNTAALFTSASSQRVTTTVLTGLGSALLTSTWEFWIKTTASTGPVAALGTLNTGSTMAVQVLLNSNGASANTPGTTQIYFRDNNAAQINATITTNLYDGSWHHVVIVVTGASTIAVYVDGTSRTVSYTANQTLGTFANFGFPLTFAARNSRGNIDLHSDIALDEVAVYTSRLSATRIQTHYSSRTNP